MLTLRGGKGHQKMGQNEIRVDSNNQTIEVFWIMKSDFGKNLIFDVMICTAKL